jgi:xanthine dehydrogenase accessory factor
MWMERGQVRRPWPFRPWVPVPVRGAPKVLPSRTVARQWEGRAAVLGSGIPALLFRKLEGVASIEEELAARLARGEAVAVATVVRTGGSPPSQPGAKLLVGEGAMLAGTLGCSEFDAAALAEAGLALQDGVPRLSRYHHELGEVEVYLEPHPERPTLVIGGATAVAASLIRFARATGFRTLLVETRADRLSAGEWPADRTVVELDRLGEALEVAGPLYAVVTDHDSPDVVPLCLLVLARPHRFIGLMGSRRHTSAHREALRERGIDEGRMAEIRTPVGIDLGGRTPEEIAVSIVAGLVAVRRGGSAGWLDAPRQAAAPV